ncbi:MAG: tetratricopeptide repeat protein [Pedosphaera sp.]|nr:tetratricopeptide repeat protein [Pedosphaera sp.]
MGALRTLGHSLEALKLTRDPFDVDDPGDGITADRLFDDVHLLPGLWKIDGYSKIRNHIVREFEVEAGVNFFEFPYDWRRDNRVAARRLARLNRVWLKLWRARSGNPDAKLVLLAHSMGGLLSRYFIECLDGWRDTHRLITFGTPYRSAPNALNFLSNGCPAGVGSLDLVDLSQLLRSFTSVYQLLPRYPCYDAGDGKLLRVGETRGIPHVDPEKAKNALAFHHEIDAGVETHQRDDAYLRNRYTLHPVVGTYQPTLQAARLVNGKVELSTTFPGETFDGDGTVPRVSATPLELEGKDAELFVALEHSASAAEAARRVRESIIARQQAIEKARSLNRPRLTAVLCSGLGQVLQADNRVQDAVLAYESGFRALARDSRLNLSEVLNQLAAVRKDFIPSERSAPADVYDAATERELAAAEADAALAVRILIQIGNAYLRQPQDGPALNAYQQALARPEIERAPKLKAYALANSGEILRRTGNAAAAEPVLAQAIVLLEQHADPLEKRRALTLLAGIRRDRGHTTEARSLYVEALVLSARADDALGEGRAYAGLGRLDLELGDVPSARRSFERALELCKRANDHEALWLVYWGLGQCHKRVGKLAQAAEALEQSLVYIGSRQRDLRTDEGKVAFLQTTQDVVDQLIEVHLDHAARGGGGRAWAGVEGYHAGLGTKRASIRGSARVSELLATPWPRGRNVPKGADRRNARSEPDRSGNPRWSRASALAAPQRSCFPQRGCRSAGNNRSGCGWRGAIAIDSTSGGASGVLWASRSDRRVRDLYGWLRDGPCSSNFAPSD